ncbi:hypothetical protein V6Z11_D05G137600 [Gossypium hirsutum]
MEGLLQAGSSYFYYKLTPDEKYLLNQSCPVRGLDLVKFTSLLHFRLIRCIYESSLVFDTAVTT